MLEAGNLSLFGFDLRRIGRVWRNGWAEAMRWPMFAWLSPAEPIRLILPDGSTQLRLGVSAQVAPAGSQAQSVAVLLADDIVLQRKLILPCLAVDELEQALELEVASISPFAAADTVWGWSSELMDGRLAVRLAIAARSHVDAAIERAGHGVANIKSGLEPEVWVVAEAPLVLRGYGEKKRFARLRAERRRILVALAVAGILLLALAATPVFQARERVFDAQRQYAALESEVAAYVAARSALNVGNEHARALQAHLADKVDIPRLLETLTQSLPDTAFLNRLDLQGRQLRIVGQAENASSLMNALGVPGSPFRDVRAPSPISRASGADKDSFVIELQVAGSADDAVKQ